MKLMIRTVTLTLVVSAAFLAVAQQARAEQVCDVTWKHAEDGEYGKGCEGSDGSLYGEIEFESHGPNSYEIIGATDPVSHSCSDELYCEFKWDGKTRTVTASDNQIIWSASHLPDELNIQCFCTLN
jgi:hypothetical protein